MRLFHTSDWHLGRGLYNYERYYEHQCFLDWLLDQLENSRPDALLIAGDIFDNSNPSAESQRQFYQFLRETQRRTPQINIIIIAGNHDSPGRLEAPAPVLNTLGVTVVGTLPRKTNGEIHLKRLITPIKDAHQDILGYCVTVPFLRPGDINYGKDGASYLENIRLLYQDCIEYAATRKENQQALIALTHCYINGCEISPDSERKITIGGLDALSTEIFDSSLDYVALGHLHRAQTVAGKDSIRYSGSPLPLSFSEMTYHHQIIQVDIEPGAPLRITPLLIPRSVEFLRIPEQAAPLNAVLKALSAFRPDKIPQEVWPYLQVPVQVTDPQLDLSVQIEEALKNKCVRLTKIDLHRPTLLEDIEENSLQSLDDLTHIRPSDIFRKLYLERYHAEPTKELMDAFQELLQIEEDLRSSK